MSSLIRYTKAESVALLLQVIEIIIAIRLGFEVQWIAFVYVLTFLQLVLMFVYDAFRKQAEEEEKK